MNHKQPCIAILVLGLLGVVLIILPYIPALNALFYAANMREAIAGIGSSLLVSALVNWVLSRTTKKQINQMEDEIKKANNATLEILGVQNNERRNQVIDIELKKTNGLVLATVTHTFDYREERKAGQKYELKIFSDFRGEIPDYDAVKKNKAEPDFYFKLVEEDNSTLADWVNLSDREKLCTVKFGKLFYSQNITLPSAGTDKRFKFIIENKYRNHDKLVWTFQEMSTHVIIKLNITPSCKDMNVYLRINHPQVDKIIEEYLEEKNHKNDINIGTSKVNVEKLTFTINKNVLPYQGFEISWDSPENDKLS